jgi:hypothetical protein
MAGRHRKSWEWYWSFGRACTGVEVRLPPLPSRRAARKVAGGHVSHSHRGIRFDRWRPACNGTSRSSQPAMEETQRNATQHRSPEADKPSIMAGAAAGWPPPMCPRTRDRSPGPAYPVSKSVASILLAAAWGSHAHQRPLGSFLWRPRL